MGEPGAFMMMDAEIQMNTIFGDGLKTAIAVEF